MLDDRTVHCIIFPTTGGSKVEIVRYDRSGKWWYESADGVRRPLKLGEAAELASQTERGVIIWQQGRNGGARFDAAVRRLRAAKGAS